MRMIVGGACQGKTEYAKQQYPKCYFEDARTKDLDSLIEAEGILHFEQMIRRFAPEPDLALELAYRLVRENEDCIIVSDEVGYGLVPVDAKDRTWREAVGRACTVLAGRSQSVVRVVCGIGQVIK